MDSRSVRILDDASAVALAGAEVFIARAAEAVEARGAFRAALAGGTTPLALYRILAEDEASSRVDWSRTWLFIGDERHVPPDHADSNYGRVREALLSKVPVPSSHVTRFESEAKDVHEAASRYEQRVRETFGAHEAALPRFDLVLLGLGADGHTASLFPGSDALRETTRLAKATWVSSLCSFRFTLTPPSINAAAHAVFLATGAEKAAALRQALEGECAPEACPAQLVRPADGDVLWLVDRAAASGLNSTAGVTGEGSQS